MAKLTLSTESWPIEGGFTISRGSKTAADVVIVHLEQDGVKGWGECVPYARYGESLQSVSDQLSAVAKAVADGAGRLDIQDLVKPGAARNALDCAFWDLEAKLAGQPVWELAGLSRPEPLITAYTISLGTPEKMGAQASANAHRPLMKLKLTGEGDLERVAAVRENAPTTRLIVDANEGWSVDQVEPFSEALKKLGVEMIEQPLPTAEDTLLSDVSHPVTLCADESAHGVADFPKLVGKYDMINIKLDKTGGLTEALELKRLAREADMQVMIGCMLATSLAMAPAALLAQGAEVVDLDGPLLLTDDRVPGLAFKGSEMEAWNPALWG
ncbi:N-acetyl-D-Glu racemase DgcA [Aestuariispira insulae]|uniref:Dipeptide epimerase n=1 Tax=Aestuariispira insulae TaxID=1461337 RepID=A0A3D9HSM7_9PROT|nr:N-acetyl-D-Glu racemase DgcA [Aestuariispira insulae]RED52351.1 L-alanine-DL-glutamate epimerase-like enolase superfamily enzyme [Aestuariispira insulae]